MRRGYSIRVEAEGPALCPLLSRKRRRTQDQHPERDFVVGVVKSLWASVQGDPVFMRRLNGWLTIFWVVMIPISFATGRRTFQANALGYSTTPKPKVTSPGSAMCTDTIAARRIRPSSTSIHSPEYGSCPLVKLSTSSRSVPSSTVFAKRSSGGIVNVRVATVSEHTPVAQPHLFIVYGGTCGDYPALGRRGERLALLPRTRGREGAGRRPTRA
jgi:hypothetical protein